MVTDSAQHHLTATSSTGLLARAGVQLRQFICALHGHDSLLHFEQGRMSLLCSSCGYETPGWETSNAPARTQAAAAPKARVVRMPLLRERRVA